MGKVTWHGRWISHHGKEFNWNAPKYFLKYIKLSIPPTNSKKPIFKWLRAIWNLCFPLISIQKWNFRAYISLNIDISLHIIDWKCLEYIVGEVTWHGRWTVPKMRLRVWLTFGQMGWPPRSALKSGWYFVRWLVGWPIAADWLAWLTGHLRKCHWPEPPPGSDYVLGWHFVRWLVGWLAGWLTGHLTKCQMCINVKDGHPLKIWFRVSLPFFQMACWLPIAAGWLTGYLSKCWYEPFPRFWIWVRLTFC